MELSQALRLPEHSAKPVIALTGAGGKSTLLFRLAAELAASSRQTLLTATTRLWARQMDQAPFALLAADAQLLARELPVALRGYRQVLVMRRPAAGNKLQGLPPAVVCQLAALADVDAVVVEADGSRERPLKAPAAHEPVVPSCTTLLLVVAGMAVLGRPLSETWVHRPELVGRLTGLRMGDVLTPEAVGHLLTHPQGGLKGRPAGAKAYLYLNLAGGGRGPAGEEQCRLAGARRIARLVLAGRGDEFAASSSAHDDAAGDRRGKASYQAVLIGNAAGPVVVQEVHGRVAAVVLAAGGSTRFGGQQVKPLLPWRPGNTLLGRVVDIALAADCLDEVVVVVGCQAGQVAAAVADRPVRVVVNAEWQAGQSSSVQAGLRALRPDVQAVIFLLADQPTVQPEVLQALVWTYRQSLAPIVAPRYRGGARGNPVLFDRSTFPELLALTGDVGGRPLIQRYGRAVRYVAVDQPRPRGVETPADYGRLRAESGSDGF